MQREDLFVRAIESDERMYTSRRSNMVDEPRDADHFHVEVRMYIPTFLYDQEIHFDRDEIDKSKLVRDMCQNIQQYNRVITAINEFSDWRMVYDESDELTFKKPVGSYDEAIEISEDVLDSWNAQALVVARKV